MVPSAESTPRLVVWLRAAGEVTRLRLLALCAERDLSVSDLATAIGQSEPRVSRHLKILSEAGLIARVRQGQWVHYQVARTGEAVGFVQGLLAQLERSNPLFVYDRERLKSSSAVGRPVKAADSRLGRALRAFMEMGRADTAVNSALVIGVDHPELLAAAAAMVQHCTAIAHSRRGAQLARAFAEREGFVCRVLLAAHSDTLGVRDLTRANPPFDVIVLDRFAASGDSLTSMLAAVRVALAPGGRLWLFERYEALESSRERVVEHPLARLRRLLSEAGFAYERLSPIEADGEHVLAATAVTAKNSDVRVA
jgi:DNA-binding transcriptional ArsR family regulator